MRATGGFLAFAVDPRDQRIRDAAEVAHDSLSHDRLFKPERTEPTNAAQRRRRILFPLMPIFFSVVYLPEVLSWVGKASISPRLESRLNRKVIH
jgi:hypothetical protein